MIGDCTVRAIAKSTSAEGSSYWFELLQIVFASDKHLSILLSKSHGIKTIFCLLFFIMMSFDQKNMVW